MFNVGDKLYYLVSRNNYMDAINNVGLNKPIMAALILGRLSGAYNTTTHFIFINIII